MRRTIRLVVDVTPDDASPEAVHDAVLAALENHAEVAADDEEEEVRGVSMVGWDDQTDGIACALEALRDIEMETRVGSQWTHEDVNELARNAIAKLERR